MNGEKQPSSPPRRAIPGQPWRNQSQFVAVLALMIIVGIIIAALYLIQTTVTTTTARMLAQMDDQRADLERENERLRAEIAQLESLPRVMTRAAELGFREARPEEIQYIAVEGYRYDRPRFTPTPTPRPLAEAPVYDETLSGWLRKQWDSLKRQFEEWRSGD